MLEILITVIKVVFLLGILILIHEAGHFFIARLCKVKVKEFSIGFGPLIWQKQGKETKYQIRLIPLGGYNNLEGEEKESDDPNSFKKASIPKRIAIVAAGSVVNIVFGLIVYFILVSSTSTYLSTTVDQVPEINGNTANLEVNDKILKIDGQKVHSNIDFNAPLENFDGGEITVTVERNGEILDVKTTPFENKVKNSGIYFSAQTENLTSEITLVQPDGPADIAGIQENDIILKVNGINVNNDPYQVVSLINEASEENITLTLQRNNKIIDISLKPEIETIYHLGVILKPVEQNFINNIYYGYIDTQDFALSIIENLKILFSGQVKADQLMGPIGISDVVSQTSGLSDFIYILALISLSLGVTNLLPIPALDGGKILLLIIEAIRRKPLKEDIEIGLQLIGFIILISLSIYVAYNDVLRLF